jgi:hypothetical protein
MIIIAFDSMANRIDAAGDGRRVGGLLYLPSHLNLARLAPACDAVSLE